MLVNNSNNSMVEEITFGSSDLLKINASLYLPSGKTPRGTALVIGSSSIEVKDLAAALSTQDIPALALEISDIERSKKDVLAAADWMRQELGPPSIIIAFDRHTEFLEDINEWLSDLSCLVLINASLSTHLDSLPTLILAHKSDPNIQNQIVYNGSAIRAARLISVWSEDYIPNSIFVSDDLTFETDGYEVTVAERETGKYSQIIRVKGSHALLADEPISVGGDDTGPSPYDLLLASVGACTSMTLRMYAARKKLPLDKVVVKLSHSKVAAEDLVEAVTTTGKVDVIVRDIELHGDLDEKTRNRMMEIADKCPVHKSLHSEIILKSKLTN